MADMAMLAKLAMLAALPLTQDGQLGLLKGRMPPFCRRGCLDTSGRMPRLPRLPCMPTLP